MVVTLIVATRAKLSAASPSQVSEIEALLTRLSQSSAADLAALEVVWSPAA